MIAKTEEDFNGLKEIGRIVASIRDKWVQRTVPGITTKELDDIAEELFKKEGAVSAPKGEYNFLAILVLVLMKKWHMEFQEIGLFVKGIS